LLRPETSIEELLRRLEESQDSPVAEKPPSINHDTTERGPVFGGLSLDDSDESPALADAPTNSAALDQTPASHTAPTDPDTLPAEAQPGEKTPQTGTAPGSGAHTTAGAPALDERVLLVEDNEVNLKVAQKLIQYIGYTFDVAKNGLEALEKVKQNRYRMVLMDCQMPVMDGYLCTQRIREYEKSAGLNSTPIIAMTANAMMGDREKCLNAGMDDYMFFGQYRCAGIKLFLQADGSRGFVW